MRKRVICKFQKSTDHTHVYRQLDSKGEPIEHNWEEDAVVGGNIYLCKVALPDRKAAPREITVTVEY
jgi:hypothetical protein